ncbi:MAG: hypothetical protein WA418_14535 [Bradyrhizobium sp.]
MTNRRRQQLTDLYKNETEEALRVTYAHAAVLAAKAHKVAAEHMEVIEEILEGAL